MAKRKRDKKKVYFYVFFWTIMLLGTYYLSLIFFYEFVTVQIAKSINILSWVFTFLLGATIPGILYEGGKGYTKIRNGKFIIKEQGFFYRFLDHLLIAGILFLMGFTFSWLFPQIIEYVVLLIIELVLLSYVAFCRDHKFNFPLGYFTGINILLIITGVLIYNYV